MVSWSDIWDGAQGIGAMAGAVALTWQALRSYSERHGRLALQTTRYGDGGIRLIVSYRPASHHVGLAAEVAITEPETARVAAIDRADGKVSLEQHIRAAMKQLEATKSTEGRLTHLASDPDGVFLGDFIILGGWQNPPSAHVLVTVRTDAFRKTLVRRRVKISGMD